jgi:DNA invertase Pin-like site-specific DNA recombinase
LGFGDSCSSGCLAEAFPRGRDVHRTREGMKVAKAKGRPRGKQPKLNRRQQAHLVSLIHSGEYSTLEVAELFGVGRSTVYRAIERQRVAAKTNIAETTARH